MKENEDCSPTVRKKLLMYATGHRHTGMVFVYLNISITCNSQSHLADECSPRSRRTLTEPLTSRFAPYHINSAYFINTDIINSKSSLFNSGEYEM